jgi:predicted DNA-binding protein
MTLRPDGRRVISVTMWPELFERLQAHCHRTDQPLTVYVRHLLDESLPPLRKKDDPAA